MSNPLAALAGIQAPSGAELTASAKAALAMVDGFVIDSDTTYQLAGEELRSIKAKAKALEEKRTAITGPINSALKAVNDLFREPSATLAQAEKLIKSAMVEYADAQARKAEAARREAEEAQRRAAAEAAAIAEQAAAAAAAGQDERAEELALEASAVEISAAVAVAPVIAPVKAAGISKVREVIKARVVDKAALVKYVADVPALLELVDINESRLNALAKALNGSINYPGVEVYTEKSISARA